MKVKKFNKLDENYDQVKHLKSADELLDIVKFLKWVAEDEQLTPGHESYNGFLNLRLDDFTSSKETHFKNRIKNIELKKQLQTFIKLYNTNNELCLHLLAQLGLYVEAHPDEDETIFYAI